jgi:transcriptional regulator, Rrf2 family
MLSNSSKYAINAVIYLAVHSSVTRKIGVKDVAEALHIPSPFLAKILQTLARKNVISSNKGPGGGFWLSDQEKEAPLMSVVEQIGEADKFIRCVMSLKQCSDDKPCPMHASVKPFRDAFRQELSDNSIASFAQKVINQEVFLLPIEDEYTD